MLWGVLLVVLFVFLSAAYRNGARVGVAAYERAAHDLRLRLVDRVLDPRAAQGGRLPGELLSVATADVDAAAGIVRAVAFGVGVAVALLAGATVLLLTSVQLGLMVLVGLPLALWASHRLARPLTRRATEQQSTAADAAGVAADLVEGHRVLHGIGGTGAGVARYRAASRASLDATLGAARAEAAYEASALLVAGVALALVALAGGRLAAAGDISIGQLIAAVGVTQFLVGPLSRLAWVGAMLARARGSAERLSAALAAPPALPDGSPEARTPAAPAGLVVRGLRHGPLDGLDLDVAPGSLHGIAAADPAASHALLRLPRQRGGAGRRVDRRRRRRAGGARPGGRAGRADDEPARRRAARRHGGRERRRGRGRRPDAVARALAAAAVEDVARGAPDGDATRLDDGGRSLSGGPAPADRAGARARGAGAGARPARADDRARRRDRGARGGRAAGGARGPDDGAGDDEPGAARGLRRGRRSSATGASRPRARTGSW